METFFQQISGFIEQSIGMSPATQSKILKSVFVLIFIWLSKWLVLRAVSRKSDDPKTRYVWSKSTTYIIVVFGLLLIGGIWFQGFKQVGTYLGILSAGIAIALKDPLTDLAGWLFILFRRPLTVGDRIQIGEQHGDVIDIRLFMFTILEIGNWVHADQSTGRIVHIPNGHIFTLPLANYSKGFQFIWNEVPVLVTFESNWKKAKSILLEIGKRHAEHLSGSAEQKLRKVSQKYMIFYKNLTPTVYTSVQDSGVLLTIRYLCEPRKRRGTEQAVWEDILDAFVKETDIDFAYPTQRFYDHQIEGKNRDVTDHRQ